MSTAKHFKQCLECRKKFDATKQLCVSIMDPSGELHESEKAPTAYWWHYDCFFKGANNKKKRPTPGYIK